MTFAVTAAAEVERVILGICLLEEASATELAVSLLRPDHFELDTHQRVFRFVCKLHGAGSPVNMVTVIQELAKASALEGVGGASYIADLTSGVPRRLSDDAVRDYSERVKEFWRNRELARLGELLALDASAPGAVASSLVQRATERLEAIVEDCGEEDASISASIVGTMDRFEVRRTMQASPGISYGIPELDRETDGMMPGEQTAVGATSGVGKTAFMAQAIWATLMAGYAVDAFLLEPTKDQVTFRLIALMAGVRYEALIKSWRSRKEEADAARRAASELSELPFRMFGRSSITLDEVLGHARIGMRKYGTRLVCTDYIQRLKIRQAERDESVRLRVGRASTALADLVKNTDAHSMVLSQITTGRKNGAQAKPTMFDFRESSQIENDAHTIILLHREFDEAQGHYTNEGAIFVPKQRNGVPTNIKAWFDPVTAAWRGTPPEQQYQQNWQDRSESHV